MTAPPQVELTRNILVSATPTDFVIQVPASWKLTFSAVNPSTPTSGGRYDQHCLRVYEGKEGDDNGKLRAVYCNVHGFRDLSIPMIRKVEKQTGSSEWTQDSEGNFEGRSDRQLEASWAPSDDPADIPF